MQRVKVVFHVLWRHRTGAYLIGEYPYVAMFLTRLVKVRMSGSLRQYIILHIMI